PGPVRPGPSATPTSHDREHRLRPAGLAWTRSVAGMPHRRTPRRRRGLASLPVARGRLPRAARDAAVAGGRRRPCTAPARRPGLPARACRPHPQSRRVGSVTSADPATTRTVPAAPWDRAGHPADAADPSPGADLPLRLAASGADRDLAVAELHELMVRGCRHQVARMRGMLPGLDSRARDDLAQAAADDAVVALLGKLHTFE